MDSLENQVRFSQLVAVIVGAKGLGKTFLISQLHQRLDEEVVIASIDASYAMSEDQLVKTISLQLGLSWQDSNDDLTQRIKSTHSQKVLVTIDNAHLLSPTCVEFILMLNQSQLSQAESFLFILLAGEKNLPNLISQTSCYTQNPDMCVVFELEPIQQLEAKLVAGSFSHPNSAMLEELKDNKKLDYFWQISKGNPAELNYHMSRWLDDHFPTEIVEVASGTTGTYFKSVIYTLLAISLVSMLVFQDEINSLFTTTPPLVVENTTESATALQESERFEENPSKVDSSTEQPFELEGVANNAKQADSPVPVNEAKESVNDKLKAKTQDTDLVTENELKIGSESAQKRKTKAINSVIDSTQLPITAQPTSEVETIPKPSIELTQQEKALLNFESSHFVLQWAGVSSLNAAQQYKQAHTAKSQMSIYRRNNNDKTLFLIISDVYSNRALAEFAKNDYLAKGVKEKPWVKPLSAVQKEIVAFRKSSQPVN